MHPDSTKDTHERPMTLKTSNSCIYLTLNVVNDLEMKKVVSTASHATYYNLPYFENLIFKDFSNAHSMFTLKVLINFCPV